MNWKVIALVVSVGALSLAALEDRSATAVPDDSIAPRQGSSTQGSDTPLEVLLPSEFLGAWRPVVDRTYIKGVGAAYAASRRPGMPSFEKIAPQLLQMEKTRWTFFPRELAASLGGETRRQAFLVKHAEAGSADLELRADDGTVLKASLTLFEPDTLDLTFPGTSSSPPIRMVRVQ